MKAIDYNRPARILTLLTVVNFSPGHSPKTPDFVVPDFSRGATPHETAQYFRSIGQPEKAESAIRGTAGTPDKIIYILTQPGVGGFKEIGKTGVQFVSLDVLDTSFQSEVHTHEQIHNADEGRWGEIDISGFEYMTPARRAVLFGQIGGDPGLDETGMAEGLTQYATQAKIGEIQSGYDRFEVPVSQRLFRKLEEKLGKKIVGSFLRMALDGSVDGKKEFADSVRIGGNIMLLEQAPQLDGFLGSDAKAMSIIIERQKQDFVIRDNTHAKRLVQSYQESQTIIRISSQ